MRIQFLGTGASEALPVMYCDCELCQKCRELGGKNIRTRQQTIINDDLLIDFPADTVMHSTLHGLCFSKVHTCLVTHAHEDHLCPTELFSRSGSTLKMVEPVLTFYGSEKVIGQIKHSTENPEKSRMARVQIDEPFQSFTVRDYKVTPLAADHANAYCGPFLYLIEKDGKAYLHGLDTAYFPESTWEYLSKLDIHLDAVALDCTFFNWDHLDKHGVDGCSYGHMGMFCCSQVKERLLEIGIADENTHVILTHLAHTAASTHDEMQKRADEYGMTVAYDGMILEI